MSKPTLFIIGILAAMAATPASAGVFADDLGRCLVRESTDADKRALVRWMFSALSADPALSSMAKLTRADRDRINLAIAKIYDRLLLVNCRREAIDALKNEGMDALRSAGGVLGGSATRLLMESPAASKELESFTDYIDEQQWNKLVEDAGIAVKK